MSDDWRPTVPALAVPCPLCRQRTGLWCLDDDQTEMRGWHQERIDEADRIWPPRPAPPRFDPSARIAELESANAALRDALREACDLGEAAAACTSERGRSTVRGYVSRLDTLRAMAEEGL